MSSTRNGFMGKLYELQVKYNLSLIKFNPTIFFIYLYILNTSYYLVELFLVGYTLNFVKIIILKFRHSMDFQCIELWPHFQYHDLLQTRFLFGWWNHNLHNMDFHWVRISYFPCQSSYWKSANFHLVSIRTPNLL